MKIKQIEWMHIESQHKVSHIGVTPIGLYYAYWHSNYGVNVSIPYPHKHIICGSIEEAKNICQDDYEKKIMDCFEKSN